MDVLRGMANGPRGPAAPGGRGGISPITMGLLALPWRRTTGRSLPSGYGASGQRTARADAGQCRRQLSRLAAKRLGRSARRRSSRYKGNVREMFSLKSIQMVEGSVCIRLRASCRVCARPPKKAILSAYPRLDMKNQLTTCICGIAKNHPNTTRDNFIADFGLKFIPGYTRPSSVDFLQKAPFAE